ncbi:hypothetical protein J2Y69_002293 [Microbacterium resistens]|uniref:Uncharacterized protein n=1 Tax=Microbacterium resistens TaxID=156977 RepID=A0ABU1SDL3_9MICO|nr:hypothetical protein [Microbacterium resistens]MDR6867689.1 hypothetical protein [Microbacterium resistens]
MGVDHPGLVQPIEDLIRNMVASAVATLQNGSLGRDGLRFYGGARLTITDGGGIDIVDTGYINIDGDITGIGDFVWEGLFRQKGDSVFEGPVTITGPDGTLTVEKETLLKALTKILANLQVENGGKVIVGAGGSVIVLDGTTGKFTAGNLTIDPSANGGSMKFTSGPEIYASGDELSLYSGGAWITLTDGMAKVSSGGLTWLEITPDGFQFVGLQTKSQGSVPGSIPGMIWADSSGVPYRIVP